MSVEMNFQLLKVLDQKGYVSPFAKKAFKNLKHFMQNDFSEREIHDKIIYHKIKNLDSSYFQFQFDDKLKTKIPTKFTTLLFENFTYLNSIERSLENIKEFHLHYVHNWEYLELQNYSNEYLRFLKQAFHIAILEEYLQERELSFSGLKLIPEKHIVTFIGDKLYPKIHYHKNIRNHLFSLSLSEAIENILFLHLTEDTTLHLPDGHPIQTIKKGSYLSFHAQIFIICLALNKKESFSFLSRIPEFSKKEDPIHKKKQIFSFFSKKLNIQDVWVQEKNLLHFRDIIQFLNKYPIQWNEFLEPERRFPSMTDVLEKKIIETEIFREFPEYQKNPIKKPFLSYFISQNLSDKKTIFDNLNYEIIRNFELNKTDIHKVKERILQESLLKTHSRNQDRFIQFSANFFINSDYWGEETKIKVYKYTTKEEQDAFLHNLKSSLSKKDFDKLNFHKGRLTDFLSCKDLKEKYKNGNYPIVIENQSIQIKLRSVIGKSYLISIQRGLMPYLLENALYKSVNPDSVGKSLLNNYIENHLLIDFQNAKEKKSLEQLSPLDKKLLPKRYLKTIHHGPINKENSKNQALFVQNMLEQTENAEKKYVLMMLKANEIGMLETFSQKNKGKEFRVRFLKKAWNHLYFKEIYKSNISQFGIHKRFHINREEFSLFTKYLYGFETEKSYKNLLIELLKSKDFYKDPEFQKLIEESKSLVDLYTNTKALLKNSIPKRPALIHKKSLQYDEVFNKNIIYINLSHFLHYLESTNQLLRDKNGRILYESKKNFPFLIKDWYYKEVLPKNEYKENGKLFNILNKIRLEDALLLEVAYYYLQKDSHVIVPNRKKVDSILHSNLVFEFPKAENRLLLEVPINKLGSFVEFIQNKGIIEGKIVGKKFIKKTLNSITSDGIIHWDNLKAKHHQSISNVLKFMRIKIELEKYYIGKYKLTLKNSDYLDVGKHISTLFPQFEPLKRKFLQFKNLQYRQDDILKELENSFIEEEIEAQKISCFQDLDKNKKAVCRVFMNTLNPHFYVKINKNNPNKNWEHFENTYFKNVIQVNTALSIKRFTNGKQL